MAKSRDYEELKEVWINWRNSAGKPVRELYKEYVQLGNKATSRMPSKLWMTYGNKLKECIRNYTFKLE